MAQLYNVWWQQRLSLATKLRIYNLSCAVCGVCGSETWTLQKIDSDRIQSCNLQSQRHILAIKWYNTVTNTAIRERTKLLDLIADRRHSLFVVYQQTNCLTSDSTISWSYGWNSCWSRLEASIKNIAPTNTGRHSAWLICWVGATQLVSLDHKLWRTLRPLAG